MGTDVPPAGPPYRFACRPVGAPGRQICKVEIADAISSSHRTCRCCGLQSGGCPPDNPLVTSSVALPSHRPAGFGLWPHPPGEPADSGIPCRRGQGRTPLCCGDGQLWNGDDGSAFGLPRMRGRSGTSLGGAPCTPLRTVSVSLPSMCLRFGLRPHPPGEPADAGIPFRSYPIIRLSRLFFFLL